MKSCCEDVTMDEVHAYMDRSGRELGLPPLPSRAEIRKEFGLPPLPSQTDSQIESVDVDRD